MCVKRMRERTDQSPSFSPWRRKEERLWSGFARLCKSLCSGLEPCTSTREIGRLNVSAGAKVRQKCGLIDALYHTVVEGFTRRRTTRKKKGKKKKMKSRSGLSTHLFRGTPVKRINNNRDTFWEQQVTSSAHTFFFIYFFLHLAYLAAVRFDYLNGSFSLVSAAFMFSTRALITRTILRRDTGEGGRGRMRKTNARSKRWKWAEQFDRSFRTVGFATTTGEDVFDRNGREICRYKLQMPYNLTSALYS